MSPPRLLDLFCRKGGAAVGYHRAGFEVVGVDVEDHSDGYPFEFHRADALELVKEHGHEFDAIHASPPCQAYSTASSKARCRGAVYPDLIELTRHALVASGNPYVIENVPTAPLINPVQLCGSSFRLDLRRHRHFESNIELVGKPCNHGWQIPRFASLNSSQRRAGRLSPVVGVHGGTTAPGFDLRCRAMGIDWMKNADLVQAIPPAYTEFIGRQILEQL